MDSSDNADETNIIGATGQFAEIYGIRDKKVECFGEMRADGNLIWIIERKDAEKNRRSTGERIIVLPPSGSPYREGGTWVWHGQSVRLSGFLKDDDNLTRDDLLCEWSARLNLEELAGKGEKAFTRGRQGSTVRNRHAPVEHTFEESGHLRV